MIKWFEKHNNISIIIAIIIGVFIFVLSSIPSSSFPSGLGITTKIYHLLIFSVLAFFLLISLVQGKTKYRVFVITTLLLVVAYAITDELHQSFVPGRTTAVSDVLIDTIGASLVAIIYTIRLNFKKLPRTK